MSVESDEKQAILLVDDSEMNRSILSEMLEDSFDIFEAQDGFEALALLQQHDNEIALILLDVVMPGMDGFEFLTIRKDLPWVARIPVIIISSESSPDYIDRAFALGAVDYLSRPYNKQVAYHRVKATISLYAEKRALEDKVYEEIVNRQKTGDMLVQILSHVVEFRNGESGPHVQNIIRMTEMLLERLREKDDSFNLDDEMIHLIGMASALHDIGKIAIPNEILNKPSALTESEMLVMKTHSAIGASFLKNVPIYQNEPLVKIAYEICRWHHERYDGSGYPDGLKGDKIPIFVQVVSIADAYDALVSRRVYKEAFPHNVALQMIVDGECGEFNPVLVECLSDISDDLKKIIK